MVKSHPKKEEAALRPVGIAMAAVVASLGAAKAAPVEHATHAPLEPASQSNTYVVDPTNAPGYGEDPDMVVGPSAPVAPFGGK
ncbi:hypothetical protein [Terricaulis sp.]|uniref:hypothetical protein n=1 Tax=Terricaulis sp. TaxID=2768686 RepID=UPI00378340E8